MLDNWITTAEAAEIGNYHINHVRRLIREGRIQARKFGTVWMVSRESFRNYLEDTQNKGRRRGPKPIKNDSNF
jgi:excisionase family DNA binding protein